MCIRLKLRVFASRGPIFKGLKASTCTEIYNSTLRPSKNSSLEWRARSFIKGKELQSLTSYSVLGTFVCSFPLIFTPAPLNLALSLPV